ncbi:MAG TPA: BrnT family toxin [Burkholderiales bacterium]|nr:BrnT family toxin [Burkholderiales bacterium]
MATWDEPKRRKNIKNHGLNFVGCEAIWDNFTITREDVRRGYQEKRLVTFGLLGGDVVVLVYTERRTGPHIISLRKAEKHEARYYFEIAKDYFK